MEHKQHTFDDHTAVADGLAAAGLVDGARIATRGLSAGGLLQVSGGEVRALVDVRPYAAEGSDLWVLSDLTPGLDGAPISVPADHVLGISSASTSLAQLTVRQPFGAALDLGTNSCRMLIAQAKGAGFHVVDSFSKSVQLGQGLEASGRLSRSAMLRRSSP